MNDYDIKLPKSNPKAPLDKHDIKTLDARIMSYGPPKAFS